MAPIPFALSVALVYLVPRVHYVLSQTLEPSRLYANSFVEADFEEYVLRRRIQFVNAVHSIEFAVPPGFHNISSQSEESSESVTPRFGSSQAQEVPAVSSSPGPSEHGQESSSSACSEIHSAQDTLSASQSALSTSTSTFGNRQGDFAQDVATLSFSGAEFADVLSERLLYVANQRGGQHLHPKIWRSVSEGSIHPVIQEVNDGFRLIKRALSSQTADDPRSTPRKYRKMEENIQRTPSADWMPTAPASPAGNRNWRGSMPIIAPPPSHYPRLPVSADTEAKIRLGKFLEREGSERIRDGFLPQPPYHGPGVQTVGVTASRYAFAAQEVSSQWEDAIGLEKTLRERAINWITTILPKHPSGGMCSRSISSASNSESSRASSFASTSSCASSQITNLYDQLSSCPETRFHAVWMFLRYFLLVTESNGTPSNYPGSHSHEEFDALIVWDIALACLALSVKFHRDFLHPLYPVQAREFLELARHDVDWEEFETAQRDILSAFGYSVGVSPQPLLDELWRALPSLRDLLRFEGRWNALQKEVWLRLYDVVYMPDLLRFPQSLLVTTVLIDTLPLLLAKRFEYDAPWHCKTIRKQGFRASEYAQARAARFLKQAREASEGVVQDIQEAVGVTNSQLRECQEWWMTSSEILS
ncbi:hypothetical protein BKA70DRAFT_1431236 [Coprinopsis sp. MPI-PUGE-AT-0042]|nr:hypothetical protein BKA70DRAFT_1431236 [Coprinopsis sp. MPI-PUGE-AT-0042]